MPGIQVRFARKRQSRCANPSGWRQDQANVSTAAKTIPRKTERANQGESTASRPNPVALEVPVSVTGARAGCEGARELFTEETQTVLVFKDGAVIQLTAPVTVGQLLFLTNKKNSTEVVCQVRGKRAFGSSTGYVELQFTEEKADYWGVVFPEGPQSGVEFRTVEHPEMVKAPAGPGAPAAPQSAEDVDQLKSQVEALRLQLQELQKKRAAVARSDSLSAGVPWMAVGSSAFARGKEELAAVNEPSPETPKAVEAPLMPTAGEMKEAARRVVGMALPMEKNEERGARKDPAEELLPKPELDFSKMPGGEPASVTFPSGSLRPPRTVQIRKVMTPLLAVIGVGLAGGAWYGKVWTYLSFGNPPTVAVGPADLGKPSTAAPKAGAAGATPPGSGLPASAAGKPGSLSETAPSAGPEKKVSAAASTAGGLDRSANEAAGETGAFAERTPEAATKKAAATSASSGKAELAGTAPDVAGADSPVLPAKLLKAENPVYPPNAMRSFITGDVKVEAVVGADGRVGEVKVLSGPRPLREAAVEALKRYKYAPATQGGKAVTSKVTQTVKFWFNP